MMLVRVYYLVTPTPRLRTLLERDPEPAFMEIVTSQQLWAADEAWPGETSPPVGMLAERFQSWFVRAWKLPTWLVELIEDESVPATQLWKVQALGDCVGHVSEWVAATE